MLYLLWVCPDWRRPGCAHEEETQERDADYEAGRGKRGKKPSRIGEAEEADKCEKERKHRRKEVKRKRKKQRLEEEAKDGEDDDDDKDGDDDDETYTPGGEDSEKDPSYQPSKEECQAARDED